MKSIDAYDLFVPDRASQESALARTTHLGIGAHQDDLEFMAFPGIAACYYSRSDWFGGIICTDGAGSVHGGPYACLTPDELAARRNQEQRLAAQAGGYSFIAQLGYRSQDLCKPLNSGLVNDLTVFLTRMRPAVIYTHNPADKHATHIRVLIAVLAACQSLPADQRPVRLLGCEMWRGLEWLDDRDKVLLDAGQNRHLAPMLNGIFDSQISGGKRYDLAVIGRRVANATLLDPRVEDQFSEVSFAMDLTPLLSMRTSDVVDFAMGFIQRLRDDVRKKLESALIS